MIQETAIAVFTQNAKLYQSLADSVKEMGIPTTQWDYNDRLTSLERWVKESNLIVFLDANEHGERCLHWLHAFADHRPKTISLWLEHEFNQAHAVEAVRAGARDLLVGDFSAEDVRELVKRVADLFMETQVPSTVIGMIGTAGGVGVSTLVANLAVGIAKFQDVPVGILDLDPNASGVGLVLNLSPNITLFDLREHVEDLDSTLIRRAAARHSSGVCLVSSEQWPPQHLPISERIVQPVLLRMQQMFPYVLVDLSRTLHPTIQAVLEGTRALLLVSSGTMMAATGAARLMQSLDLIEYPRHNTFWISNSITEAAGISRRQMYRVMSRKPLAEIPFAPDLVNRAVEEGMCLAELAPRATITKKLQMLTQTVCRSFGHFEKAIPDEGVSLGKTLSGMLGLG